MSFVHEQVTTFVDRINFPFIPEEIRELKNYANMHNVPVLYDESLVFLRFLTQVHSPKRILEIGTAIGYSGIAMLLCSEDSKLSTIEIDEASHNLAAENFKALNLSSRVRQYLGDAALILGALCKGRNSQKSKVRLQESQEMQESQDLKTLRESQDFQESQNFQEEQELQNLETFQESQEMQDDESDDFDMIFIDAAKAQYLEYFKLCEPLMGKNCIVVFDNVLYKGIVAGLPHIRRNNSIAKRLNELFSYIEKSKRYEMSLLGVGDGILLVKKREDNMQFTQDTDGIKAEAV